MKFLLLPLLLLFAVTGCGKKAQESSETATDKTQQPSSDGIYFSSLKDVMKAIETDDVTTFQNAVSSGSIDLNKFLLDGDTFLIRAIRINSRKIRNYLLERGANINKTNISKETPLMVAIREGRMNTIRVLLDKKADLHLKNAEDETALHIAIRKKNDAVAVLLIKEGAKIEVVDKKNKNAIDLSKDFELPETSALIDLMLKVDAGAPDVASFRRILDTADVTNLTKVVTLYPKIVSAYEVINPLAILVESEDLNNALRSAQILLNNKANVNGPDNADFPPLIKATRAKKHGFMNLYLNSKANPHITDRFGKSSLFHAIDVNNPELVDLLLTFSPAEKFTYRKNGKKISPCKHTFDQASKLKTPEEKALNKKIQESLDCSFIDRFVQSENGNE